MYGLYPYRLWPCNGTLVPNEHCFLFFFRVYQEEDQSTTRSGAARFGGLDPGLHVHTLHFLPFFTYRRRMCLHFGELLKGQFHHLRGVLKGMIPYLQTGYYI